MGQSTAEGDVVRQSLLCTTLGGDLWGARIHQKPFCRWPDSRQFEDFFRRNDGLEWDGIIFASGNLQTERVLFAAIEKLFST